MTLYLDRFEGELAVLLDEGGASHLVARALLPAEAREGMRVRFAVSLSEDGPDVAALRGRLTRADDGGDIEL